MTHQRTLCLVACSATKGAAGPARELYTGPLFQAARRHAEARGYHWRILSAKHGLLRPDAVVLPYDQRLEKGREGAKADTWGRTLVKPSLCWLARTEQIDRVIWFAGADYRDALHGWRRCHDIETRRAWIPCSCGARVVHEYPLAGLAIGQQLGWFKRRREDAQTLLF